MKVIVGLGNPGNKYTHTRHNAGFLALDFYLKDLETISCTSRFQGQVCEVHFSARIPHLASPILGEGKDRSGSPPRIGGVRGGTIQSIKTFFVKPQTYMNRSGEAIRELANFYKINPETDLLVVHDEIDLKFGYTKLAFDSRPAGHNGVKSIVEELGTQKFHRLRIGIESRLNRAESPTDEYVLSQFTAHELAALQNKIFPSVKDSIEQFITG